MDIEYTTNPADGGETSLADIAGREAEVGSDAETQDIALDGALDEEGNPIDASESADEDSEEIERDGVTYKIPKALAKELMMHADYTRKTQDVAEQRKALEAERASFHQAGAEEVAVRARITAIDDRLAAYGEVDWGAWNDEDPFEAQKGFMEFQQLKDARGQAVGALGQMAQRRTLAQQQETARRIEEGRAVLARDIKGWSDELAGRLLETGIRQYGFDRAEIESFEDPRMVKVLHDAHQYQILQKKQKQAQRHEAAQQVQPAARVGGASPKAGLDDRLGAEEWVRRREAELRKRR